ncbi:MAG: hypothetical protein P8X58_08050 [Syntrophobacterales bacterium]
MAGVSVIPVKSKQEMKTFVDFPWELYRDDPYWIPPVKSQVAKLLTPGRHPFWQFSRREIFLALRARPPFSVRPSSGCGRRAWNSSGAP